MAQHRVGQVLVVDVRQREEYETGHIPGAVLAPLIRLLDGELDLEPAEHLICCCLTGYRAEIAAAALAERREQGQIYALVGGLVAYNGAVVQDAPRIGTLELAGDARGMLRRGIGLEKGAHLLYTALVPFFQGSAQQARIEGLARAEVQHAKLLHGVLTQVAPRAARSFEEELAGASGLLLESGESLPEALARPRQGRDREGLLELGVAMELRAHDLYRNLARRLDAPAPRQAVLELASEERRHAEALLQLMGQLAQEADADRH